MMDQHFVNEATKFLYDKSTNLKGELATFNELLEEYAKKTRTLEATVEELTNDANARTEETIEAKKHQKKCIAAAKEAEKQKKLGEKSLEKAVLSLDAAGSAEEVGKETKTHYTFLLDRKSHHLPSDSGLFDFFSSLFDSIKSQVLPSQV